MQEVQSELAGQAAEGWRRGGEENIRGSGLPQLPHISIGRPHHMQR